MKHKQLYTMPIPPVSKDYATTLDKRFPLLSIKHTTTMEEIQFNAGQRSVVDFVLNTSIGTTVSTDITDIKPTPTTVSLLDKLLGRK